MYDECIFSHTLEADFEQLGKPMEPYLWLLKPPHPVCIKLIQSRSALGFFPTHKHAGPRIGLHIRVRAWLGAAVTVTTSVPVSRIEGS